MLDAIVLDLDNATTVNAHVCADVDVQGLIDVDLGADVDADVDLDVLDTNVTL